MIVLRNKNSFLVTCALISLISFANSLPIDLTHPKANVEDIAKASTGAASISQKSAAVNGTEIYSGSSSPILNTEKPGTNLKIHNIGFTGGQSQNASFSRKSMSISEGTVQYVASTQSSDDSLNKSENYSHTHGNPNLGPIFGYTEPSEAKTHKMDDSTSNNSHQMNDSTLNNDHQMNDSIPNNGHQMNDSLPNDSYQINSSTPNNGTATTGVSYAEQHRSLDNKQTASEINMKNQQVTDVKQNNSSGISSVLVTEFDIETVEEQNHNLTTVTQTESGLNKTSLHAFVDQEHNPEASNNQSGSRIGEKNSEVTDQKYLADDKNKTATVIDKTDSHAPGDLKHHLEINTNQSALGIDEKTSQVPDKQQFNLADDKNQTVAGDNKTILQVSNKNEHYAEGSTNQTAVDVKGKTQQVTVHNFHLNSSDKQTAPEINVNDTKPSEIKENTSHLQNVAKSDGTTTIGEELNHKQSSKEKEVENHETSNAKIDNTTGIEMTYRKIAELSDKQPHLSPGNNNQTKTGNIFFAAVAGVDQNGTENQTKRTQEFINGESSKLNHQYELEDSTTETTVQNMKITHIVTDDKQQRSNNATGNNINSTEETGSNKSSSENVAKNLSTIEVDGLNYRKPLEIIDLKARFQENNTGINFGFIRKRRQPSVDLTEHESEERLEDQLHTGVTIPFDQIYTENIHNVNILGKNFTDKSGVNYNNSEIVADHQLPSDEMKLNNISTESYKHSKSLINHQDLETSEDELSGEIKVNERHPFENASDHQNKPVHVDNDTRTKVNYEQAFEEPKLLTDLLAKSSLNIIKPLAEKVDYQHQLDNSSNPNTIAGVHSERKIHQPVDVTHNLTANQSNKELALKTEKIYQPEDDPHYLTAQRSDIIYRQVFNFSASNQHQPQANHHQISETNSNDTQGLANERGLREDNIDDKYAEERNMSYKQSERSARNHQIETMFQSKTSSGTNANNRQALMEGHQQSKTENIQNDAADRTAESTHSGNAQELRNNMDNHGSQAIVASHIPLIAGHQHQLHDSSYNLSNIRAGFGQAEKEMTIQNYGLKNEGNLQSDIVNKNDTQTSSTENDGDHYLNNSRKQATVEEHHNYSEAKNKPGHYLHNVSNGFLPFHERIMGNQQQIANKSQNQSSNEIAITYRHALSGNENVLGNNHSTENKATGVNTITRHRQMIQTATNGNLNISMTSADTGVLGRTFSETDQNLQPGYNHGIESVGSTDKINHRQPLEVLTIDELKPLDEIANLSQIILLLEDYDNLFTKESNDAEQTESDKNNYATKLEEVSSSPLKTFANVSNEKNESELHTSGESNEAGLAVRYEDLENKNNMSHTEDIKTQVILNDTNSRKGDVIELNPYNGTSQQEIRKESMDSTGSSLQESATVQSNDPTLEELNDGEATQTTIMQPVVPINVGNIFFKFPLLKSKPYARFGPGIL